MMNIKVALLVGLCWIQAHSAWSQDLDQARLNRDLKITEDILSSLVKSESRDGHFYAVNPKGSYIPNYGVIIQMNSGNSFYSSHYDNSFKFNFNDENIDINFDLGDIQELAREAQQIAQDKEREARDMEREIRDMERESERAEREREQENRELERETQIIEREKRELEREQHESHKDQYKSKHKTTSSQLNRNNDDEFTYRRSYSDNNHKKKNNYESDNYPDIEFHYSRKNSGNENLRELYEDVMTVFFTDYANLISQLKPDEKIMITVGSGKYNNTWNSGGQNKFNGEILVKNLNDYKSNKISKDQFINTINFSETNTEEKKAADLELLTSIFQRMYKADLATTFYTSSKIQHERIKNFGVMYKIKVYVSTKSGPDTYKITSTGQSDLTREERNKLAKEMYPTFERELKENILKYGKTVTSLDQDETILFQVELASCTSCDIPKKITLITKYQTILDLDSGEINQEQAIAQIKRGD